MNVTGFNEAGCKYTERVQRYFSEYKCQKSDLVQKRTNIQSSTTTPSPNTAASPTTPYEAPCGWTTTQTMSSPSLSSISNVILLNICDELSLSSLGSLRATNRSFYDRLTPLYVTGIYERCKSTGMSPLYHACKGLNAPFAILLIRYGADVLESQLATFGGQNVPLETPLYMCSMKARRNIKEALAIARALLQAGAEINKTSQSTNQTPLHVAVRVKSIPMVRLLLEWGADLSVRNREGITPLHLCVQDSEYADFGRSLKIAQLVLEAGAGVDPRTFMRMEESYRDEFGMTPLLWAAHGPLTDGYRGNKRLNPEQLPRSRTEMVELLLKYGADVHAKDKYGNTALSLCAMYGSIHCFAISNVLVDAGAEVDTLSEKGATPLQLCAENTDHLKRRLVAAQEAGAKLYALPEGEADGKIAQSEGVEELKRRAQLAMAKLFVERGADVEAVYPEDPELVLIMRVRMGNWEDPKF
jgi:ankyrin repeat protein